MLLPVNPVFQMFRSSRACLYFNITLPSVGYKKRGITGKLNLPNATLQSCWKFPAGIVKNKHHHFTWTKYRLGVTKPDNIKIKTSFGNKLTIQSFPLVIEGRFHNLKTSIKRSSLAETQDVLHDVQIYLALHFVKISILYHLDFQSPFTLGPSYFVFQHQEPASWFDLNERSPEEVVSIITTH